MADRFVSPSGSGSAATQANPSALSDALNNTGGVTINAGDQVWLRGGTYTNANSGATDKYVCNQGNGAAAAPIVYRAFPGERVIIDGAGSDAHSVFVSFSSGAHDLIFRDLEGTDSQAHRAGAPASDLPGGIYSNHGQGTTRIAIVNCIFHDMGGSGIGAFYDGPAYLYGNLFYYCGSYQNQKHSIYYNDTDNVVAPGTVVEANVSMFSGGYGWHLYGDHNRFRIQSNTSACSGRLSGTSSGGNLLLGHEIAGVSGPSINGLVDSNYTYSPDNTSYELLLGFEVGWNNVTFSNNRSVGADIRFYNVQNRNCVFTNNNLEGNFFTNGVSGVPTVIGSGNTFTNDGSRPGSGIEVYIVPNKFEPGRCHVTIYNWDHANTVNVNLATGGVRVGDDYAVYWWPNLVTRVACLTGTYAGGNVAFPMTAGVLGAMPNPTWDAAFQPPTTVLPEFSVFIVQTLTRRN